MGKGHALSGFDWYIYNLNEKKRKERKEKEKYKKKTKKLFHQISFDEAMAQMKKAKNIWKNHLKTLFLFGGSNFLWYNTIVEG